MKRTWVILGLLVALVLTVGSARRRGGQNYKAVGYAPENASQFTSNQWLSASGATLGVADGKQGLVSFWYKNDTAGDPTGYVMYDSASGTKGPRLIHNTGGTFQILAKNTAGSFVLNISWTGMAYDVWYHVMASWDLATTTGHVYTNGVDASPTLTLTDDTIEYDNSSTYNIARATTSGNALHGCLAEFYFNFSEYLDLSSSANRDKFYSSGTPVDLGSDGSTPTGTAPEIYLKSAYTAFEVNAGSGGNFTVNAGPLTDCGTYP